MQIHELNNFTGTLGSGAYLAIDDGTDTGKISSQGLLAATEARIDNIIAGPAPSAQEVTDARLGADGVVYPSLGDAIRDQVTDLKSALNNLAENGIHKDSLTWEHGGIDNATGENNNEGSLTRSRVATYMKCSEYDSVTNNNTSGAYNLWIIYYDQNKNFASSVAVAHEESVNIINDNDNKYYFRLDLRAALDYTDLIDLYKYTKTENQTRIFINAVEEEFKLKLDADIGKNICNAYDDDNVVDNTYTIYNTGKIASLSDWCSIQFPVIGGRAISSNVSGAHFAFFSQYNDIADATIPSFLNGYISGTTGVLSGFTVPASAKYAVISIPISKKATVQVEYGLTQTSYEPYIKGLHANKVIGLECVETVEYDIYADGTGDFSNLKTCFESITDSSKTKRYIVRIHAGEYDIASLYNDYSVSGLTVPNYVKLVGVGDKHNVILKAILNTQSTSFSLLNIKDVCDIENMTLKSKNCRYTVHDDFQTSRDTDCIRNIKDVIFIGENCAYGSVYGSGLKGSAVWNFENCEFDATKAAANGTAGNAFSNHNNTNVTTPSFITFRNCRLLNGSASYKTVRLLSMTSGSANGTVTVTFEGNKVDGIYLGENDAAQYGAGICYWVNGFGNVNTLGVGISNTDGIDYSGNVDLI